MLDKKLVIFDFCGTLINFQTADRYVKFCVERLKDNKVVQCRRRLVQLMDKLRVFKIYNIIRPGNNWRKRMILWQIKGVKYDVCDMLAKTYFREELLPNVVQPVVEKLKGHLANGDRVCILSGGYDIYIKYFAQYFEIQEYIASTIDFQNGYCTGKMQGLDCMRENKLIYFHKIRKNNEFTVFYTDSSSDIPLLKIVDEKIVISKEKSQQWAEQLKYQQIIWN